MDRGSAISIHIFPADGYRDGSVMLNTLSLACCLVDMQGLHAAYMYTRLARPRAPAPPGVSSATHPSALRKAPDMRAVGTQLQRFLTGGSPLAAALVFDVPTATRLRSYLHQWPWLLGNKLRYQPDGPSPVPADPGPHSFQVGC
jgi:hypothetical protein